MWKWGVFTRWATPDSAPLHVQHARAGLLVIARMCVVVVWHCDMAVDPPSVWLEVLGHVSKVHALVIKDLHAKCAALGHQLGAV